MKLAVVLDNIRSTHNVGSLLRSADGLGAHAVYLCGYTPYPVTKGDERLPHIYKKVEAAINKTALGAQNSVNWKHMKNIEGCINMLKSAGYEICAVEQSPQSVQLSAYQPTDKVAIILGPEVEGISAKTLSLADKILEIPMRGSKESLNVSVAGAVTMYDLLNR